MPWEDRKDVERHNKKCAKYKRCSDLWLKTANKYYRETKDDGLAVLRANVKAKNWLIKHGYYRANPERDPEDSLLSDEEVWESIRARQHQDIPEWIGPIKSLPSIDGDEVEYRMRFTGFTEREYYSHAGPGWDYRWGMFEKLREEGRDFSDDLRYEWDEADLQT